MLTFSADNCIIRLESLAIRAYIHGRRELAVKLWGMAEERRGRE